MSETARRADAARVIVEDMSAEDRAAILAMIPAEELVRAVGLPCEYPDHLGVPCSGPPTLRVCVGSPCMACCDAHACGEAVPWVRP